MGLRLSTEEIRERRRHAEQVLATARMLLAASSLVAIYLDPTEPTRHAKLAYGLLVAYVIYSLFVLVLLRISKSVTPTFLAAVLMTDAIWPGVISLFTEGPNSPFFLFFVFAILAAAYRWGLRDSILNTAIMVLAFFLIATAATYGPAARFLGMEFDLNRVIMRAAYLIIIGFLAGYLGDKEKQAQAELSAIARIASKAEVRTGLTSTINAVLGELLRLFRCGRAALIFQEAPTERVFLWNALRGQDGNLVMSRRELNSDEQKPYRFVLPVETVQAVQPESRTQSVVTVAEPPATPAPSAPPEFLAQNNCRRLLVSSFRLGSDWTGCIFLFDPEENGPWAERFLYRLVSQVGPTVYNVYLLRRLRSRAAEVERARVGRQLHDGAIQELAAIEMHLYVLRKGKIDKPEELAGELKNVQLMVHNQIANLRELMQQLTPLEFDRKQFVGFLAGEVERYRDIGINARFVSDLKEVSLPARVCRELAQILREALMNVRKHSAARNVVVRFAFEDMHWKLVIEDDGRGFGFSGKLSHAELDSQHAGPRIIKERVRSMGGELLIESYPYGGTRLEIRLPQKAPVTYG